MSWTPAPDPTTAETELAPDIDLVLEARKRDLGDDFIVGRVLPSPRRRLVGPFIFFDEMGPVTLAPGHALNVRPHPHINLATVTYLFEGAIMHRDSLGSAQLITPGAVNWMTAGRGIVHSERTPLEEQRAGARMHGIQLWCGLPTANEETAPTFEHYPADVLPSLSGDGLTIRVLAGDAYGLHSPVRTLSRLFYIDVHATAATTLELPDGYPERAAYIVSGAVRCDDQEFARGAMLVFAPDRTISLALAADTRLMLLGGDPLDGTREIYWNFVSSRPERIEQAKQAWRDRKFPSIPGDDVEFIPLPD